MTTYPPAYTTSMNESYQPPSMVTASSGQIPMDSQQIKKILDQANRIPPTSNFLKNQQPKILGRTQLQHDIAVPRPIRYQVSEAPLRESMMNSLVSRADHMYTISTEPLSDLYESIYSQYPEYRFQESVMEASQIMNPKKSILKSQILPVMAEQPYTYQDVSNSCNQLQVEFLDSLFPPNRSSLGENFPDYHWNRSKIIFNNKQKVFNTTMEPIDIIPGILNNKYFLSCLAAMTLNPDRIKNLIVSKELSRSGCYAGKLVWKGVWREIIIDDYFPTVENKPVFCKGRNQELWPMILEKCWAKVHRSYNQIDLGLAKEALHDLTGAPTRSFLTKNADPKQWQALMMAVEKKFIILANPQNKVDPNSAFDTEGNYIITHAATITDKNGQAFNVLRLRNPWNTAEWTGKFNDADAIWKNFAADQQKLVGYTGKKDPQQFCMDSQDFLKYFHDFAAACYIDGYTYHGIPATAANKQPKFFTVHVPTNGAYAFQVSQSSIRLTSIPEQKAMTQNEFYSRICLIVTQQGVTQPIIAVYGKQRDLTSWKAIQNKMQVAAGDYYACIIIEGPRQQNQFGFGVYGPQKASISETTGNMTGQFPATVMQILGSPQMMEAV